MDSVRSHEQEAWCNEFATLYRFETKLGAVTRARPSVETLQGNLNLRKPR